MNVFILCTDTNTIKAIDKTIDDLCMNSMCTYSVTQSKIVNGFFYIRIEPLAIENLNDIKEVLSKTIEKFKTSISWYKIETIEVK